MSKWIWMAVCLWLAAGVVACGEDSSEGGGDGDAAGDGDGDVVGDGDAAGDGDGDAAGDGDMSGDGDTVGDGDGDGGGSSRCDATIEDVATCGTATCADPDIPSYIAGRYCIRTCCIDENTCGIRRGLTEEPTDCKPEPLPDDRCPSYSLRGIPADGCCTEDNLCGALLVDNCTSNKAIFEAGQNPPAETLIDCDGNSLGLGDAGMPDSGL